MTTPVEEPFAGKQTDTTCPNCGRSLFSGLADGNVLICRDAEGNGCQLAYDPNIDYGESAVAVGLTVDKVEASPVTGPPNEAPDTQTELGYLEEAIHEPWVAPTSAPQAQNAVVEEAPEEPAPAPAPTPPPPPPTPSPDTEQQ